MNRKEFEREIVHTIERMVRYVTTGIRSEPEGTYTVNAGEYELFRVICADVARELSRARGFDRHHAAERARCAAIARAARDATIGQRHDAYGVADAILGGIEDAENEGFTFPGRTVI